jgi:hypothetical protein
VRYETDVLWLEDTVRFQRSVGSIASKTATLLLIFSLGACGSDPEPNEPGPPPEPPALESVTTINWTRGWLVVTFQRRHAHHPRGRPASRD